MSVAPFDPLARRRFRERSCAAWQDDAQFVAQAGALLCERLADFKRPFDTILVVDSRAGALARRLAVTHGSACVVMLDESWNFARLSQTRLQHAPLKTQMYNVTANAEILPLRDSYFDAVIVGFGLHLLNDLPGALIQLRKTLVPDGLFLANMPCRPSLTTLAEALLQAELDVRGGASPRIAPLIDGQTFAGLLLRAGFQHPVVDEDSYSTKIPDIRNAMALLRNIGESNCLKERPRQFTPSALFRQAQKYWQEKGTNMTVNVMTATAHAPSQAPS